MGVKERKEREKQKRVSDILEAASRQFEAKGFLNTTLQDVALAAEVSVGLIYRYFQSKEDIFASLALKGAEQIDKDIERILKRARTSNKVKASIVLGQIANRFFEFYEPYGDYFDMMVYSYKGLKKVQIQSNTLTRLMSVTLSTLDKVKEYVVECDEFMASNEDEALQIVFLFWALLLGTQKLFDRSGRGHLFAFTQDEFIKDIFSKMIKGIGKPEVESKKR